ncbi:hypothetical protein ACEWY4_005840 [Coilia grayii]|uniref:Exocyst complex component 3 n=1 Tax=Coilia grayii TaxID=363190 RepID=A0ABD1KJL8_9TELE
MPLPWKKKTGSLSSLSGLLGRGSSRRKKGEKREEKENEEKETSLPLRTLSRENHDAVVPPGGERQTGIEWSGSMDRHGSESSAAACASDSNPAYSGLQDQELGQEALEVLEQLLRDRTTSASGVGQERERGQSDLLLEAWGRRNPVTGQEGGGGGGRYPQDWLCQYQQQVEEAVRLHFPSVPPEGSPQQHPELDTYLRQVQKMVQGELLRLAPMLKEAGLLGTLIDSYHVHTMSQLELLLQRNLNTDQTFTLLRWTLKTYLSEEVLGHRELHSDVMKHMDFLLYTESVQKTQLHLIKTAQEEMELCVQGVLQGGAGLCEDAQTDPLEETTKCVSVCVQRAQELSPTLQSSLSLQLSQQLHGFVQRYVAMETKKKSPSLQLTLAAKDLKPLFYTCNTCAQLRTLAVQLASEAQTDAAATVDLLEELQTQATQQLLHTTAHNIEVPVRTYLKTGEGDLSEVQTRIQQLFVPLPLVKDTHTHKTLVDSVYECITSSYLRHLLLSNRQQLDSKWGDVRDRVSQDAEELHNTFTTQDGGVEKRCVCLQKVCEVLRNNDVDTLKLILMELIIACPSISEQQLSALLKWKGGLSAAQMSEVLEAVLEHSPRSALTEPPTHTSPSPAPPSPTPMWCHALPCLRSSITA